MQQEHLFNVFPGNLFNIFKLLRGNSSETYQKKHLQQKKQQT